MDRPRPTRPARLLRLFASASIAYPLLEIGLFYCEWLLAWHAFGHEPQWSIDDPKFIDGSSWMHPINWWLLLGTLPACFASIALNIAYLVRYRPSAVQGGIRVFTLVGLRLGLFVWMHNGRDSAIVEWWLD